MKNIYLAHTNDEYMYVKQFFKYPSLSYVKDTDLLNVMEEDIIIMTSESNPEVMAICYNQGWAANQDYMFKSEAEAVTDIGTAFQNGLYHTSVNMNYNNFINSFDEFKYFINVTSITFHAFNAQTKMKSITLPKSIKTIGSRSFEGCIVLSKINLPNNLISISNYAFNMCYALTDIKIPNSVTSIGDSAFSECTSLREITIPNSVTSIDNNTFKKCSSLTSITIPNSVTSIGIYAFSECYSLSSIEIPDSVTSIGSYAFHYCESLSKITCLAETAPTVSFDTFYNICSNGILHYPQGSNYSSWMSTSNYYLGKYNWTLQTI